MERRIFLSLSLSSLISLPALGDEQQSLSVSTLIGADPAETVAEQILREAYRQLGIVLVVQRLPGERSLVSANDGSTDGELYRRLGMEREYLNLIMVPVPLQTYEIVVFSLGMRFAVLGWDSLRPFSIGYVRGIKIVEQNTAGMKTEAVPTMTHALQKLVLGRTDIVVGNRRSGMAAAKALKIEGLQILEPALASFPVFHYLNKKHAQLVPKLEAILRRMQKDKVIEKIQDSVYAND